ncbi:helicase-primase subunit [Ateline alphaherpesvirus 1]|uniref:Helicase-primase subunit n=1 Tax=Herpesvirus ateles type 1 (strain Lennette) TaxID=35243 RepID=A0A1S6JLP5_HSVA1|nr:helicase-primase subunit [Ateline alphaherpesvirus 1]AQS79208.1 helicase-primase subunit [Ateline alphaherpesvirus 1]
MGETARAAAAASPAPDEVTERICAATLYTAWNPPRRARLHAIVYLLCRDAASAYQPRFAEVSVGAEELNAYYHLPGGHPPDAPREITPRGVAAAVLAASDPRRRPLETLRQPHLWRAAYAAVMAALGRDVGRFALFRPARLRLSAETGLVERIEDLGPRDGGDNGDAPRAGVLTLEADLPLDPEAVGARALETPGASLAWARLAALRDAPGAADAAAATVSVSTRAGSFRRAYDALARPPVSREGDVGVVFEVRSRVLRPREHDREIAVRVPVPTAHDYLAVPAAGFSAPALIALLRQWHAAVFAEPGAVASAFAFLGPEFEPLGWRGVAAAPPHPRADQLMTLGFPGWPTLRVAPAPPGAAGGAAAAYASTGGGWPGLSAGCALLSPPPAAWPRLAAAAAAALPPRLREYVAQWRPGRTEVAARLLDPPAAVGRVWIARFRFRALAPALVAHLGRPGRPAGACGWWPALEGAAAGAGGDPEGGPTAARLVAELRAEQPAADRFVGGVTGAVLTRVEEAATGVRFAVCGAGGEEGAFWGVFDADPRDAAAAAEACAAAAAAFRARAAALLEGEAGFSPAAAAAAAAVTLEGTYTHAVLWGRAGRWLWNEDDDRAHAEGFSAASPAHRTGAETAGRALRELLADPQRTTAERARGIMEEACDALVGEAFARRADPEYWSVRGPPPAESETASAAAERPLPPAALRGGALMDADRGAGRRTLRVRSADGESVDVPVDLFPAPPVLPPIDCAHHLSAVLREVEGAFNGYLLGRWEDEEPFAYPLADKFGFLFP